MRLCNVLYCCRRTDKFELDMDLHPIGKHCALQSCNALDFLPIQCSCLGWFCKLHISPDLHDCFAVQQRLAFQPSATWTHSKCALLGCNKSSLTTGVSTVDLAQEGQSREAIPRGCPGCQLSFCVEYVRRHCVASSRYLTRLIVTVICNLTHALALPLRKLM